MKLLKPRLSARMARQLAKNLILRLDIETLIERPDSDEAERIREKYRSKKNDL